MMQDKFDEKETGPETIAEGGPGDVETAGETTAASAIHGPVDTRPVGADTMVKVEGADEPQDDGRA